MHKQACAGAARRPLPFEDHAELQLDALSVTLRASLRAAPFGLLFNPLPGLVPGALFSPLLDPLPHSLFGKVKQEQRMRPEVGQAALGQQSQQGQQQQGGQREGAGAQPHHGLGPAHTAAQAGLSAGRRHSAGAV